MGTQTFNGQRKEEVQSMIYLHIFIYKFKATCVLVLHLEIYQRFDGIIITTHEVDEKWWQNEKFLGFKENRALKPLKDLECFGLK